jgi:predicted transcriptional regulator YheO
VDFLGRVLGPDYEVALHEINENTQSIVAISNGHVSGRKVGAPVTDWALKMIKDKAYLNHDYILNYKGIAKSGKILRSSTFFIKNDQDKLVGMLCINFDNSRFLELSKKIMDLCNVNADPSWKGNHLLFSVSNSLSGQSAGQVESFPDSISEIIEDVIKSSLSNSNIPVDRLTQAEKLHIVDLLNQKGIFLLKGAVSQTAKQLSCSEPTIYRYLNMLTSEKNNDNG